MASRLRIGDKERDAAAKMLQEHHALGRLDAQEFHDRMGRALRARTQSVIDELFADLPQPRPAKPDLGAGPLVPAEPQATKHADPWYAQWWMILVATSLAAVVQGPFAVVVPLMAIWLWVVYPQLPATKQRRAQRKAVGGHVKAHLTTADYARELTRNQRRAITRELKRGRRVNAIAMYQDFARASRPYATDVIETWQRHIKGK